MSKLQAWFGGTFDPVHPGHLQPVQSLAKLIGISKVMLMPNHVPPHRPQPEASPQQRVAMLKIASAGNDLFAIDTRELNKTTPSWTLESLRQIRAEKGDSPVAFIIGQDALLTLHHWHCWTELTRLCHLLVCMRPGYPDKHPDASVQHWIEQHITQNIATLHNTAYGHIFMAETPRLAISATEIRYRLHQGLPCDDILAAGVLDYIRQTGLYRGQN